MASLNMANINTLFKKGYLLAGVIMAANMFVVNEVRAMEQTNSDKLKGKLNNPLIIEEKPINEKEKGKIGTGAQENTGIPGAQPEQNILDRLLSHENTINLIGGVVFSCANNYFKWWDYNAGSYCNLRIGCLGWRTKKLFDIVQVGINLNLGRGILWLIPGTYNFIKGSITGKEVYVKPLYVSCLLANSVFSISGENGSLFTIALIFFFLLQGFVSAPLTFHISNFSIAISFDSMLWAGIGKFLELKMEKKKKEEEEKKLKGEEELKKIDTKA